MAKKVIVQLIDDIDQTPIDDGGEHITFAVDGTEYEIDLGPDNAAQFRQALGQYIEYAAKVTSSNGSSRASATRSASTRDSPEHTRAIRQWASENGYDVSARGRIRSEIRQAYDAAH